MQREQLWKGHGAVPVSHTDVSVHSVAMLHEMTSSALNCSNLLEDPEKHEQLVTSSWRIYNLIIQISVMHLRIITQEMNWEPFKCKVHLSRQVVLCFQHGREKHSWLLTTRWLFFYACKKKKKKTNWFVTLETVTPFSYFMQSTFFLLLRFTHHTAPDWCETISVNWLMFTDHSMSLFSIKLRVCINVMWALPDCETPAYMDLPVWFAPSGILCDPSAAEQL